MKPSRHSVPREVQQFCEKLISDKQYRANLTIRLHEGTLPPAMETMVWYYAAGKPIERLEVEEGGTDYRNMTKEQLADRLMSLREEALRLQEEEAALPDAESLPN